MFIVAFSVEAAPASTELPAPVCFAVVAFFITFQLKPKALKMQSFIFNYFHAGLQLVETALFASE